MTIMDAVHRLTDDDRISAYGEGASERASERPPHAPIAESCLHILLRPSVLPSLPSLVERATVGLSRKTSRLEIQRHIRR